MAAKLREVVGAADNRPRVIDDCIEVLDLEVQDKGGLGGMAIKSAYKLVKGVRPGFIRDVINYLLDDFLDALEPLYQEAAEKGARPSEHLKANGARAADALLGVTDAKAERAKMKVVKKTYEKLRPGAQKHVEAAMPRLGSLLDKHAPTE